MKVFKLFSCAVEPGLESEIEVEVESRGTPQKMRWRSRAKVVFPLDEGPEMPTIRACEGSVGSGEVMLCGTAVSWERNAG